MKNYMIKALKLGVLTIFAYGVIEGIVEERTKSVKEKAFKEGLITGALLVNLTNDSKEKEESK